MHIFVNMQQKQRVSTQFSHLHTHLRVFKWGREKPKQKESSRARKRFRTVIMDANGEKIPNSTQWKKRLKVHSTQQYTLKNTQQSHLERGRDSENAITKKYPTVHIERRKITHTTRCTWKRRHQKISEKCVNYGLCSTKTHTYRLALK